MGFTNLHNIATIRSFHRAEDYFNATSKPRSHKWAGIERPLKDSRSEHYVLRRHNADTYEVCLYCTPVIRYHRPAEDGSYCIEVLTTHHVATKQWLWKHVDIPSTVFALRDTDGNNRLVGLLDGEHIRLTFDAANRLITSASTTGVLARRVTSPERKAQRKELSKALEPYMMMAYYASMGRSPIDWRQRLPERLARNKVTSILRNNPVDEVPPELWGEIMSPVGDAPPKKAIGDLKISLINAVFPQRNAFECYPPFPLESDVSVAINSLYSLRRVP